MKVDRFAVRRRVAEIRHKKPLAPPTASMSEQCARHAALDIDAGELQDVIRLQRRLVRLPSLKKRGCCLMSEVVKPRLTLGAVFCH